MSRGWAVPLLLVLLLLLLVGSYGVRYQLMEEASWVGVCSTQGAPWPCEVRSLLGLAIHHQVMAWAALGLALLAQLLRGPGGKWLAGLALVCGVPALVLYTASIAAFALVLAGLRLVRS
ncbi:MAG: hypothetical protein LBE53_18920 [Paucimonas sp.]|uniref:hypothetical protein n=1 Tax=Pantoea sp. Cy-639 TaxID=2608360 RepID=UPI001422DA68|nr:hypothetical protein [Pantoea sp. Cy-639]MDR2309248.1 hypothetical protein [Paucimonas sp.]NIF16695.1 hypothetical protein [Pantoea sp. Cy-639]